MSNRIDFDVNVNKIKYELGNSGKFIEFDTGDIGFPQRLEECTEKIAEYTGNLAKKHNINGIEDAGNLETGDVLEDIRLMREADKFIKEQLDFAFGAPICDIVFGDVNCISTNRQGEFYFEQFLEAIYPIIEKEYHTRINATTKKVKTYTDRKGMHPALK